MASFHAESILILLWSLQWSEWLEVKLHYGLNSAVGHPSSSFSSPSAHHRRTSSVSIFIVLCRKYTTYCSVRSESASKAVQFHNVRLTVWCLKQWFKCGSHQVRGINVAHLYECRSNGTYFCPIWCIHTLLCYCDRETFTPDSTLKGVAFQCDCSNSSSSSSFIFKTREMSKSIQIKAGTTRQKTALMVALGIHVNTSIKH